MDVHMKKKMICIGLILFIIGIAVFIIFTIKNKYSKNNNKYKEKKYKKR